MIVDELSAAEPVLRVDSVSKRFGSVVALDTLSLSLSAGQRMALVGPNGSGKSTLLNVVGGSLRQDSGEVWLKGRRAHREAFKRARAGLSRTFQLDPAFEGLSVSESFSVPSLSRAPFPAQLERAANLRPSASALRAAEALGALGLLEQETDELSFGQRRLVGIAMAFATDPDLILLDEPSAGLSPSMIDRLISFLAGGGIRRNSTILVAEHNFSFLKSTCDTCAALSRGRIVLQGRLEEVLTAGALSSVYTV